MTVAVVHTPNELRDRLRLIASRLVIAGKLEVHYRGSSVRKIAAPENFYYSAGVNGLLQSAAGAIEAVCGQVLITA
jgi:hypothetical protein